MLIYKISNINTGKCYIGKTTKSIEERFKNHLYSSKHGSNTILHKSIRKHGIDVFDIEIIENCCENIDEREKYWINEFDSMMPNGYNMTTGGEGGDTSKSKNWIDGMKKRKDMSGENNPMYGKSRKGERHKGGENISKGTKMSWDNDPARKKLYSEKYLGDNNPMYGKTPSNALKVKFEDTIYPSFAAASRETKRSVYYIKKHSEIINE